MTFEEKRQLSENINEVRGNEGVGVGSQPEEPGWRTVGWEFGVGAMKIWFARDVGPLCFSRPRMFLAPFFFLSGIPSLVSRRQCGTFDTLPSIPIPPSHGSVLFPLVEFLSCRPSACTGLWPLCSSMSRR